MASGICLPVVQQVELSARKWARHVSCVQVRRGYINLEIANIPGIDYVEYSFLATASYFTKNAMPHMVGNEITREHPVHLPQVSLQEIQAARVYLPLVE